jgi:transcriptional regulator with XRE-family HTH domain
MGYTSRRRPTRLAEKLLQIRKALGLSQNEMIRCLGLEDELIQGTISAYELGNREPSLTVLLQYARVAGVYMEVFVDDELDLPQRLPASPKSEGIRRRPPKNTRHH